jgi:hypothetical protein
VILCRPQLMGTAMGVQAGPGLPSCGCFPTELVIYGDAQATVGLRLSQEEELRWRRPVDPQGLDRRHAGARSELVSRGRNGATSKLGEDKCRQAQGQEGAQYAQVNQILRHTHS